MAKIYEKPIDVEREWLAEHAKKTHAEARNASDGAWSGAMFAFFSDAMHERSFLRAERLNQTASPFMQGVYKVGMWVGIVTGLMSFVTWLSKRNEASRTETKLQMLGPEEVKLPGGMHSVEMAPVVDGKHCERLQQEVAGGHIRSI